MSRSKPLRFLILWLISLLGLLILVGVVAWWHELAYGIQNPEKVQPTEDWTLGLGVGMIIIQLATAVEVLFISLATRLRWLKFNRGRNAVGLFSLIMLTFALPNVGRRSSVTPETIGAILLYLLYLMSPVMPAWGLLYFRRTQELVDK